MKLLCLRHFYPTPGSHTSWRVGALSYLPLDPCKISTNCLKLKRHWINVCWTTFAWVSSVWLPGLYWHSWGYRTAAAKQQPARPPRLGGSFWTETWGRLCISRKIRPTARGSQHKQQRPGQKSKDKRERLRILYQWYHFQNGKFRKNTVSQL